MTAGGEIPEPQPELTFETYQDAAGEWRWRLVAANGRIIGDSGEGYETRDALLNAIALISLEAHAARVTHREGPRP